MTLKIAPCSAAAARFAIENWHYSRRVPVCKLVRFGVWERDKFIGAVLFGHGSNMHLGRPLGLEQTQICELLRIGLSSHDASVSRIVSIATRLLRKTNPGLRAIISFADPAQGHHGGIYQALGWRYTGTSAASKQYLFDGVWKHIRSVSAIMFDKRIVTKAVHLMRQGLLPSRVIPGKHRYVLPLDAEVAAIVQAMSHPYPKRHASENGSRGGSPIAEGGSIPTQTLQ